MANGIQFYFNKAIKLLEKEKYQESIDTLTKIIDAVEATNKDKANAYNNRGVAYEKLGEYDKAILTIQKQFRYLQIKMATQVCITIAAILTLHKVSKIRQ